MSKRNKSARKQSAPVSTPLASAQTVPAPAPVTATVATEQTKSNRELKREAAAAHARKQRYRRYAISSVIAVIALLGIGLIVREVARPKPGDAVTVMASGHIEETAAQPEYNSNPPTSGPHYAFTAQQGYFDKDSPKDEALVHNLEHGYVILWYDCAKLDQIGCDTLKSQLQGVIDRATLSQFTPTKKLIAVPRKDFGATLALTSWGRIQKLDQFDEAAINTFIQDWREKSPEPQAS